MPEEIEQKNDYKKEFIKEYKTIFSNHLIKIFDKTGRQIVDIEDKEEDLMEALKLYINCFFQEALKLNTVSFLFGTGSSIPLGAKGINEIPKEIVDKIDEKGLKATHDKIINTRENKNINLEEYLGDLIRIKTVFEKYCKDKKNRIFNPFRITQLKKISSLIIIIKETLYNLCNVPSEQKITDEAYKTDPLIFHKIFIRKLLTRPINLRRANIFTTNYDLAFEKSMDELGVLYIDGFVGNTRRMFKPEVYNYDFYFPATTTEGDVHRLDKVIHLYKLHGSLNWSETNSNEQNIYGIEQEKNIDGSKFYEKLLIYPQIMKDEETIGFPYSEMFRRFSGTIQQPQNVLITYGYAFGDEHINRVIYNALSISTFQLIVVSYNWSEKLKIFYGKVKDDSRISFIIGEFFANWKYFVTELLPDIGQKDIEQKILKTVKELKEFEKNGEQNAK